MKSMEKMNKCQVHCAPFVRIAYRTVHALHYSQKLFSLSRPGLNFLFTIWKKKKKEDRDRQIRSGPERKRGQEKEGQSNEDTHNGHMIIELIDNRKFVNRFRFYISKTKIIIMTLCLSTSAHNADTQQCAPPLAQPQPASQPPHFIQLRPITNHVINKIEAFSGFFSSISLSLSKREITWPRQMF